MMVRFECDRCKFAATHKVFGMDFAYRWLKSSRTEVARCSEFGAKTECDGILRSGLSDAQIDHEMETLGYGEYIQRYFGTKAGRASDEPAEQATEPAEQATEPAEQATEPAEQATEQVEQT